MASSRQIAQLCRHLLAGDYQFSADTRRELDALIRKTGIRSELPGYTTEGDSHPLPVRAWWPNQESLFDAHLVSIVSVKPFAVRACHMTIGKPTSFSFARTIRAAILEPCGLPGLASSPSLVVLDGDAMCRASSLFDFIKASGSRRLIGKRGAPHAKPRVEGAGAILQGAASYPIELFEEVWGDDLPAGTLALPVAALAQTYQSALMKVNELRLPAWIDGMHRCALGLRPERIAEISALRWPVTVTIRDGRAKLETGETYISSSIIDLDAGLYCGTRSFDLGNDDVEITIEGEVVAFGTRCHAYPQELSSFQSFLEPPRI